MDRESVATLFHEFESCIEFQPAWSISQKRNSLSISLLTIYPALGIVVALDHSRPNSSAKFCTSVQNFILHSPGPSLNPNPQRQAVSRFEGRMLMRKATRLIMLTTALLVCFCSPALAQTSGSISGAVRDEKQA